MIKSLGGVGLALAVVLGVGRGEGAPFVAASLSQECDSPLTEFWSGRWQIQQPCVAALALLQRNHRLRRRQL
jgi:hypothetical protein